MSGGSFGSFLDAARGMPSSSALRGNMIRARLHDRLAGLEDCSRSMEDFPCFQFCESCGQLGTGLAPCSHCGASSWIDLQNSVYARYLAESEDFLRREIPRGVRWLGWLISIGLFTAFTTIWLHMWDIPLRSLLARGGLTGSSAEVIVMLGVLVMLVFSPICLIPGISLYLGRATHLPIARLVRKLQTLWRPLKARRWLAPAPGVHALPKDAPSTTVEHAEGPLLISPLTGRRCLAYQVSIMLRDPMATYEQVPMLDQRQAVSLTDGEVRYDDSSIIPLLSPTPVTPHALQQAEERHRFLRERGIFWEDGEIIWMEAIIPPETSVQLTPLQTPKGQLWIATPA